MRIRDLKESKAQEQQLREELLKKRLRYAATIMAEEAGTMPPPIDVVPAKSPFEAMLGRRLARLDGRYHGLIETAPDAIVVVNDHGNIILLNAQAERQFGYDRDELLGNPVANIVPVGLAERLLPGEGEVPFDTLSKLVGVPIELAGRRKDASEFPVEIMLSPLLNSDGLVVTISFRNISAHKTAERKLIQLESRYRSLLDMAPDAMVVVNKRGKIVLVNKQAEQCFGYVHDELLGRMIREIVPSGLSDMLSPDGASVIEAIDRVAGKCLELTGLAKDGSEFPMELMLSSLQSAEGIFVTAAIRHIGERRAHEQQLVARETRYRSLLEAAPYAMLVVDPHGRIMLANASAERLFGYRRRDELVGRKAEELVPVGFAERLHVGDLAAAEEHLSKQLGTGIELIGLKQSGETFPLELMLGRLDQSDGSLVTAAFRDLSGRKRSENISMTAFLSGNAFGPEIERGRMEEALFGEHERAQVTLNAIADAVACTDRDGRIEFLNRVAQQMTGWSLADAAGRPMDEIVRIVDATTREPVPSPLQRALSGALVEPDRNCLLIRRDGLETPIEDSVAPIHDRQGRPAGAVIVFRDVRAARSAALEMAHSARHDFLTGLPNRMLFNDRVTQAITVAPRHGKKVAVLFLDLDGFKHVNDTLGHQIGDKLLQSVAKRLVGCVRAADTVCRQGGDEFVVLLSEVEHVEDPAILANRMLRSVADVHHVDGHDLHVTASIGVSVFPDDGLDASTLIKNADLAMYQAKEGGRQGFKFFTPALNQRVAERQTIEIGLRRALEQLEFTLHYQPKVNLKTGEIAGAEALIRWSQTAPGAMSPADFLPVAESSGLIDPIGQWVIREACRQTRAWLDAGLRLPRIAVNISPFQFRNESFVETIFKILEETGVHPSFLELELTEGVLMKNADSTAILQTLRDRGVRLAVDDFGTGYSSLSNLQKYPIDTLKIDQSFVRQIGRPGEDASLVTTVLSMARSLKLHCVAEGVETAQELAFLQAHHCDVAQGYYFSRPLPPQQFGRLLQTGLLETMAERRLEAVHFAAVG